ncbi:hypothetical protein QOT17_017027 [Balamuthia mandrillaris]
MASKKTHIIVYNDTRKTVTIGTKNFIGWLSTEDVSPGKTWTYDTTDIFGNHYIKNVHFVFGDKEIFAPLTSAGKYKLSTLLREAQAFCKISELAGVINDILR